MSSHRVAIVTGAGQGIGRAIALRLADNGFAVAICDLMSNKSSLDRLTEEMNAKKRVTLPVILDVSKEEQVKSMVERIVRELGALDVMVATASVWTCKSLFETTVDDWDRVFATNVRGTFLCYKYAGQQMVLQGHEGRIIGAASVVGEGGTPLLAGYNATKAAIQSLTQTAAKELGKYGITVNAYAPKAIDVNILREMISTSDEAEKNPGDFYKEMDRRGATGYKGTLKEIASMVSYLASEESHFITGQSVLCEGGIHFG